MPYIELDARLEDEGLVLLGEPHVWRHLHKAKANIFMGWPASCCMPSSVDLQATQRRCVEQGLHNEHKSSIIPWQAAELPVHYDPAAPAPSAPSRS